MSERWDKAYLKECSVLYEKLCTLLSRLDIRRDAEMILQCIEQVARFARHHHPGRFADGLLDNKALEIGRHLKEYTFPASGGDTDCPFPSLTRDGSHHVLHVATTVLVYGGHTRLINNWMKNDTDSCHSLLLIDQHSERVPGWLTDTIKNQNGEVMQFPSDAPLLQKAQWLRQVVSTGIDLVVLHLHPYDMVPIVAFATQKCPPVAMMDHADHLFWIGSSVADVMINFRESGLSLSRHRRYSRANVLMPLPMEMPRPVTTREEARCALELQEADVMVMSIGSA